MQKREGSTVGTRTKGGAHAHIDETTPIRVIDSYEQLTDNKQGEKSQEQDFAQEIEQMLEQMDMNVVHLELDQDIDLVPKE